jgi:diguanylate cyclase
VAASTLLRLFAPTVLAPRLRRSVRSLKLRLALGGMLAAALGIGATTALLLDRAEADMLQARKASELSDVVRSARLIDARLRQLQQALVWTAPQLPAGPPRDAAALTRFLEARSVLRGTFDSVGIVDPSGQVHTMWDGQGYRSPGPNIADRAYFRTAVDEGRPAASGLIVGRIRAEPMVVLALPVKRDGQVQSVLIGTLELRRRDLASTITEASSEEADGEITVVTDVEGQILAHPDPARVGLPIVAEPRLATAMARWREMGRPLEPSGLGIDDPVAVVSAAAVPGADWMVWRVRSFHSVTAPLRAARGQALRGALGVMAATGCLLLLLLWWQLAPLERLRARAAHLFDGQHAPADGWPRDGGEIGELARVLRQVAAERSQLEAANAQVIQRMESVMAAAPVGIAFTRAGQFELVSAEMCRLLGRSEAQLLGQSGQIIYASNEDYLALGPRVAAAFAAGQPFDGELQFLRGDGRTFPGRLRGMPVDRVHTRIGTIWTLTDITEEVAARQSLEWAASHDTLTGLANRKAFEQQIERLFEALPRSRPAALLLLDLDRFKPINDNHGHAAGDAMLRAVASAVQACVRGGDLAVRLGGDEFAVLLERCPADVALRVAEDVRNAVAQTRLQWQGHALSVGASIGLAVLSEDFGSAVDWVAAADQACYEAKAGGRNRVHAAGMPALPVPAPPLRLIAETSA